MSHFVRLAAAGLAAAWVGAAWAQAGIYTCVDGHGRRYTSDRPIVQCVDREQQELNPSGSVRRVVPPLLSPNERAAQEARDRRAAEEKQRLAEQKRVQKLLLARYPNQAAHDAERAKALRHAQGPERDRLNQRFDAELAVLKKLWAGEGSTTAASDGAPSAQ